MDWRSSDSQMELNWHWIGKLDIDWVEIQNLFSVLWESRSSIDTYFFINLSALAGCRPICGQLMYCRLGQYRVRSIVSNHNTVWSLWSCRSGLVMDWQYMRSVYILCCLWYFLFQSAMVPLSVYSSHAETSRSSIVLVPLTKWGIVTRIGNRLVAKWHWIGVGLAEWQWSGLIGIATSRRRA